MNTVWEILYARQLPLHYVAPPICEVVFSGSSSPVIVLSEPSIGKVTGLVLGGAGGFDLSWNAFPGALCFNVYYIGGDNVAVPLGQCVQAPFTLPTDLGQVFIIVTAITLEGEGPPSDPLPLPGGTFFLTIASDPDGAPFSLGPADIHGASSGVATTSREFNSGQRVYVTAEQTHNFAAFDGWLLGGTPYSDTLTTSVVMNANYTLTAVYICGEMQGENVPDDFTLTGPTSLGIFSVPPGLDAVVISGDAAASDYDIIYRGGSIRSINEGGCLPSTECPQCCFLPPGCLFKYNNEVNSIDVSETDTIEDHCVVDQATVESSVPTGKTFQIAHTGGSIKFQWEDPITLDGVEFPITDFECGDSCPQWEVIQDSGLIAQPASWRIRDYDAWASLLMPLECLDASCPNCEELTSTNFPLETDPNAVEWDGTSTQGVIHDHIYVSNFFTDGIPFFVTPAPDFFPIKIKGFKGLLAEVAGPRDQAFILAELGGPYQTDPFPPSSVDRYWRFIIYAPGPGGPPIWCGVKAIGSTPIGQYNRISCVCPASAPQCMYLEAGE